MFGRFGWAEILVIVVLVVILFGHNKIPGMMKNLADGVNIFKKELKTTNKNVNSADAKKANGNNTVKNVNKSQSVKKSQPKKNTAATKNMAAKKNTAPKTAARVRQKTAKK